MQRAALAASGVRPVVERQEAYLRRERVRAYLEGQHYVIFPGVIFDLTDVRERGRAVDWLVGLLEAVG